MVSQLLKNDAITFVVSKPFSSRGKTYEVGDDFPQEDARDIEVFVRARYVIPVLEDPEAKVNIRHWHQELRPKDEVLERLSRERVQLVMPEPYHEPDSNEVVDLDVLTHPETTPEPTQAADTESGAGGGTDEDPEPPESLEETYDPAEHNVVAVLEYISEHPEQKDEVLAMERAGRGRKGILGDDE